MKRSLTNKQRNKKIKRSGSSRVFLLRYSSHTMKLLLTSDGWSTDAIKQTFLSLLVKPPQECSVFLIVCVQSPEEQRWIDMDREELQSMGIEKISVYNLLEEKIPPQISADVLCVCGGNTFLYLDRLQKTGMDQVIEQAILADRSIYVGISAGSIIAGPDIEIAGWGSEGDMNERQLKNLKGFHLTDTAIFPHYKPEQKNEVESFCKKVSYPVLPVADGQALLITGEKQTLISSSL